MDGWMDGWMDGMTGTCCTYRENEIHQILVRIS